MSDSMFQNEGNVDRMIRVVLSIVLFFVAMAYQSFTLMIVALIPLVTAAIGFCPFYSLFNWSTRPKTDQ